MNQMQKMTQTAQEVGVLLQAKGSLLVTAESCTGGLIGAVCTNIAGSSAWFYGGIISYSEAMKLLKVKP